MHTYDTIIIGSGLAGMSDAVDLSEVMMRPIAEYMTKCGGTIIVNNKVDSVRVHGGKVVAVDAEHALAKTS